MPIRRAFRRIWWSSLPLRVVVSTLFASTIILLLGGVLLVQLATNGVMDSKQRSIIAEAQTAVDIAQAGLGAATVNRDSIDRRLKEIADDATNRGRTSGQYDVVVQGRAAARYQPSSVLAGDPVPLNLKIAMTQPRYLYWQPSLISYADGRRVPGIVVGALLEAQPGGDSYPIYFIFPLTNEVKTLEVLQQAVVSVGLLLLVALGLISYIVARTITSPVRRAALSAKRLAAGHLDERLPVKGTDDIALLGTSMNHMASELETQISEYEELARVQQQFVSDVSHELRTPLTTVRMAAEVLYDNRDAFDPVTERSAELLHDELDRFEGLLADLLEISRFDAGAALLATDEADLGDVVAAEIAVQTPFAERSGTPITLHRDGDLKAHMDARRVQRILRNLITNAIEHGEGRPIDITVAGSDDAVAVTVRDHGVGFQASQVAMVFHRFWRADPARARTVGGTGLGLAISLEDAKLHGGLLNAWGRPGRGAQFRLVLPREAGGTFTRPPLTVAPVDEISGEGTA